MFEFTIKDGALLNEFKEELRVYLNKSFRFTTNYLANPALSDYPDSERLVMLSVNKAIYQNLYSFFQLNESNLQYAAFACLEYAAFAMRLYYVLLTRKESRYEYITSPDFALEKYEQEIEDEREEANDPEAIEFSVKEFCEGLRRLNSFELKNASVGSQLRDGNLFLGLASGSPVSDELQHEVRKNLIGAYHSLNRHMKLFFNGGLNEELEDMENSLDEKYLAYLRNY